VAPWPPVGALSRPPASESPSTTASPSAAGAAELAEELAALAAIFPDALVDGGAVRVAGRLGGATLILGAYPSAPPRVELEGLRRGAAAAVAARVAAQSAARAGEPHLFELVAALREAVGAGGEEGGGGEGEAAGEAAEAPVPAPAAPPFPVAHGPLVVERKSTFQAHVAAVRSPADVAAALAAVRASSPRIARATHNMLAYRFEGADGRARADNDDDGECGAGAKLAELLEHMRATNVLAVVSRWYGGVPLGPSRFAVIANVARVALVEGGFERR